MKLISNPTNLPWSFLLQNLSHKFLLIRDLHIRCIKEEEHVSINDAKGTPDAIQQNEEKM
jgi:hypothetical protein